jgi:phosphomannomutase/phosphoglucomutase
MSEDLKTRRLFGTNGIRGIPNEELTTDFCLSVGKAIGTFFGSNIVIGSDNRISRSMIVDAVNAGILSTGSHTIYIGVLPTPAIQYYCKKHGLPGVMITASHNPPQFNGIKCIDSDGTELERAKEEKIEEIYFTGKFKKIKWDSVGSRVDDNSGFELYLKGVMDKIDVDKIRKRKFKVAADLGNGAAYLTTPELLSRLGAKVVTLNANPDGLFTSRESEPKPANLKYLIDLIKDGDFDLGIAHDGDADRAVFIDSDGNFIDGDKTLSLFVKNYINEDEKVVTPISSSDSIDEICKAKNAKVVRTKVGAPIVSRTMIEEKARLGGEENGGIIYGDHQYCRDGAMTLGIILDIIAKTGKDLTELISELPQFFMTRMTIPTKGDFNEVSKKLEKKYVGWEVSYIDGIKIRNGSRWILARPSGTEPIIRIFTHSNSIEESENMAKEVSSLLSIP